MSNTLRRKRARKVKAQAQAKRDIPEVLAELRRLPGSEATPVVRFTSARKDLKEQHCLELGASAYVEKPREFDGFLAAVHATLSQWLPQDDA